MAHYHPKYSDIDISFTPNPYQVLNTGKGDIMTRTEVNSVKGAIRNLIQFSFGDKTPFHPEISANIRRLLFEQNDLLSAVVAKRTLGDLLMKYEPRADIQQVDVEMFPDENGARIIIVFNIVNQTNPNKLEIDIERVR